MTGRQRQYFIRVSIFLAVGWGTVWAAKSPANITFDSDYDLFYQDQVHRLLPQAQKIIPLAYQHITRQWNLPYNGLLHPLTVQFKDVPSETLRRWQVAYLQSVGTGDELHFFLVVNIGAYLQQPDEDLQTILTHEMAHAILHDVEAGPQTAPIPPWFDEGMAQSTTKEGHARTRQDVLELELSGMPLQLCDLDGPVDEFAHGPFNASCYPEYYLAVQRLLQLGGPQALSKLLTGLHDGQPMTYLIPHLTGMDWNTFKENVTHYAQKVFSGSQRIP